MFEDNVLGISPARTQGGWRLRQWGAAPAAARDIVTDRSRPGTIIIDFADALRSGRAKRIREQSSKDNQTGFTLMDLAALVYALMAVAFYPALAWFLIPS
jgi:hypothetical protein